MGLYSTATCRKIVDQESDILTKTETKIMPVLLIQIPCVCGGGINVGKS